MNSALLVGATALMASALVAGELDDKLIRLIGPDVKFVYGVDFDRYGNSTLKEFFPIDAVRHVNHLRTAGSEVLEVVMAEYADPSGFRRLVIFRGALSPLTFTPVGTQTDVAAINYKGVLILTDSDQSVALLDPNIAIAGTFLALQEAIDRWQQEIAPSDPLRSTLRDLSRNYDLWFLVQNPLEPPPDRPLRPESVYVRELIQAMEAIQGGIRFGGSIELRLDAITKTPEDAAAAAAIGRWLPGFIQLEGRGDPQSAVVDLAEDLNILVNGNVASLSFRLSERRLRELADAEAQKKAAESQADDGIRF
jgi:hypothetical protein